MNRKLLWAFLAIGVVLFALPLVISLPAKASAGERMMQNFEPIMQPDQVQTTVRYYDEVFVPLGAVAPALNAGTVAQFEDAPPGLRLIAMRRRSSCTAEQIEYERRRSWPSTSARSVRCCPCV